MLAHDSEAAQADLSRASSPKVGAAPIGGGGGREREIVLFPSYTPACLAFLASSFFLMVLDFYGLQMAHLTPHSVMLLAIFTHLYEMFIAVQSWLMLLTHGFIWFEYHHRWLLLIAAVEA
jgi:hypothetical protein